MDCLSNKSYKTYEYTSRYTSIPYYYNNNDDKYMYGLSKQLSKQADYLIHNVESGDTLDSLALKYYFRPDLFWIIADFNGITDSFIKLEDTYTKLLIPTITDVKFV